MGEITSADLAERVKAMTGSCSPIQYIPYDQAYEAGFEDMPRRVPDISKIREFVGYEPKVQLDEIIRHRHRAHARQLGRRGRTDKDSHEVPRLRPRYRRFRLLRGGRARPGAAHAAD